MYKLYLLEKQLRKINKLKLQEIKNQNFESAASYRDQEKLILHEIAAAKKKLKSGPLFRFLRIIMNLYSGKRN